MIQRKQSLWLFIAAMLNGLLFILPIYVWGNPHVAVKSSEYIQLVLMAALATILPLMSIFFFSNRGRQKGLVWLSIVASLGYFGLAVLQKQDLETKNPLIAYQYAIPGILVTIIAVIFMIMALRGIRKDDKLIRSLDRLR
jgi:O-antigen ligase